MFVSHSTPIKIMMIAIIFIIVYSTVTADQKCFIYSYIGDVTLKRGSKLLPLSVGKHLQIGDILKLETKSMLVVIVSDSKISITGPIIYKIINLDLHSGAKRRNILQNYYAYMAGNIIPYTRTTVSGMKARMPEYQSLMEEAVELENEGSYDEAMKKYEEAISCDHVSLGIRSVIEFNMAELYFKKMEFEKALKLYARLIGVEETREFKNIEDSYARAILCCEILGRDKFLHYLSKDYLEKYGKAGKYSDSIKEMSAL